MNKSWKTFETLLLFGVEDVVCSTEKYGIIKLDMTNRMCTVNVFIPWVILWLGKCSNDMDIRMCRLARLIAPIKSSLLACQYHDINLQCTLEEYASTDVIEYFQHC